LPAVALRLERTESSVRQRATFLRLPPSERDRVVLVKRQLNTLARTNKSKKKEANALTNPINNKIRQDEKLAYKEELARQQGHNPPPKSWHVANTTSLLSKPEAQAVMAVAGFGVHTYAYSKGGLLTENLGRDYQPPVGVRYDRLVDHRLRVQRARALHSCPRRMGR